jgi:hypothetical protein
MPTYLTYADHMLESSRFWWKFPKLQGNFSLQNLCTKIPRCIVSKKGQNRYRYVEVCTLKECTFN